jgi:hypothetical protein
VIESRIGEPSLKELAEKLPLDEGAQSRVRWVLIMNGILLGGVALVIALRSWKNRRTSS